MTVNLTGLGDPVAEAVDAAVESGHEESERTYLGASVIGEPCERKLWYAFRWAHEPERFVGRMLRLFRTGHHQEDLIIADLRRAGLEVSDRDPDTGEQWEYRAIGGHFRCHPDGFVTKVPGAPVARHGLEVKTHNAKSFAEIEKHGVEVAKPTHGAQMQMEMELGGAERCLYVAVNKNDESMRTERVKRDPARSLNLLAKAERIIKADAAPHRIKDDPDAWPCRACPALLVCHADVFARRNCRTCLHARPVIDGDAGEWTCTKFDTVLSDEAQREGCHAHRYLPTLVPGEIADVDAATEVVTYRLNCGTMWSDGAPQ